MQWKYAEICSFICKICISLYIAYIAFICTPHFADGHLPQAVTVVTRWGPPSLAAARQAPPQSTPARHSPRPFSLGWRRGPPLLAAARLTNSATHRRRDARAEAYVVARIWNTLIAIFRTPWSPYYVYSCMNSYMNSYVEYSYIWIHIWVHIWIHRIYFQTWNHIWIHMCEYEFIYEFICKNSFDSTLLGTP